MKVRPAKRAEKYKETWSLLHLSYYEGKTVYIDSENDFEQISLRIFVKL